MPGDAAPISYMTYAEFLAFEEKSETKLEWVDGVVYDMSGGTLTHARLQARVTGMLYVQLENKRCEAFGSELAILVRAAKLHAYPDASVICGPPEMDPENPNAATNPRVIVEVLSDSTEAYDRGKKFAHYQRIPSLMEYVLVSQHEPCIEVFRRQANGTWSPAETYRLGQHAQLKSIECELPIDKVYGVHAKPLPRA